MPIELAGFLAFLALLAIAHLCSVVRAHQRAPRLYDRELDRRPLPSVFTMRRPSAQKLFDRIERPAGQVRLP